jgi:maltoporin
MNHHKLRTIAAAASLLALSTHSFAQTAPAPNPIPDERQSSSKPSEVLDADSMTKQVDTAVQKAMAATGLEFTGYMRTGFYGASGNGPKGGYALGGDLQKYRLGNEGDNYLEFGIGKKWSLGDGLKWGTYYMPKVYDGNTGTAQLYTDISGLSFAPELTFWAGQRFHRIADIHIVDNWLAQDGDNYGAGVDGFKIGSGTLNIAASTDGNMDNKNTSFNNAKRVNLQLINLVVNPGGKLNVTAGFVSGDFKQGKDGSALGLVHQQANFLATGLDNTLFLQTSTGHASLSGQFFNLDTSTASINGGAKQSRIADTINWQIGQFGGQALIGYQTMDPDSGGKVKDFSIGGRISYGIAKNTKLLAEVGSTKREIDGQASQRLNKGTVAVAFAPNTNFWSRPEFRLYATRANWNDAAGLANASSFGANNRSSNTAFGAQIEAWW